MRITNLIGMLDSGEFSDLKIVVGQGDNKKVFTAHKVVLVSTSGYFRRCCGPESKFKEGKDDTVTLPETDPRIFEMLLQCLYSSEWNVEIQDEDTSKLYIAADYFHMDTLKLAIVRRIALEFAQRHWKESARKDSLIAVIYSILSLYRENENEIFLELTKDMLRNNGSDLKELLCAEEVQRLIEQNAKLGLFFIKLLIKS